MRRTLFLIPHEIGPLPLFGFGWVLLMLVAAFAIRLVWAAGQAKRSGGGDDGDHGGETLRPPTVAEVIAGEGVFWLVAAVLAVFVLPGVELKNHDGQPVGMAIRGYGVFLVLGVAGGILLAAYRGERRGISRDLIYSLAPWTFIGGIVGARMFYVIQYRSEFIGDTWIETIRNMLAFTEGGLVVYGSFIGGFIATLVFTWRHKIPWLRLGDAIVPAIFLGMFFGRIGCLLNGCCYGGRCEEGWAALHFPPLTAVYQQQLTGGELLGMRIDPDSGTILSVAADSIADDLGIEAGQVYQAGDFDGRGFADAPATLPREALVPGWMMRISGKTYVLAAEDLPARSLPVRAAQPISSLTGLALCVALCVLSLFIRRTGAIMFIGFAAYAVVRFILEIIRVDEAGQLGTSLSISQWVSMVVFTLSIVGLIWIYFFRDPAGDEDVLPAEPA